MDVIHQWAAVLELQGIEQLAGRLDGTSWTNLPVGCSAGVAKHRAACRSARWDLMDVIHQWAAVLDFQGTEQLAGRLDETLWTKSPAGCSAGVARHRAACRSARWDLMDVIHQWAAVLELQGTEQLAGQLDGTSWM
jgi:hypothetical protein